MDDGPQDGEPLLQRPIPQRFTECGRGGLQPTDALGARLLPTWISSEALNAERLSGQLGSSAS